VNAKDALAVLSYGKAARGDVVRIVADGEDEDVAIEGLRELIESGLGETLE
jgi:phosphotransferase system HPr-like phosphotransfer protein